MPISSSLAHHAAPVIARDPPLAMRGRGAAVSATGHCRGSLGSARCAADPERALQP